MLILTTMETSKALNCWVCINARTNKQCNTEGRLSRCTPDMASCENTVEKRAGGMMIRKQCQAPENCRNRYVQNAHGPLYPAKCNLDILNTLCSCCCNKDGCNKEALFCFDDDAPDESEECIEWAQRGFCNNDFREFMLDHCKASCKKYGDDEGSGYGA